MGGIRRLGLHFEQSNDLANYCCSCASLTCILDQIIKRDVGDGSDFRDLCFLLHIGSNQDTDEILDRVYALLGLVPDILRSRFPVDYSDAARQNYHRVYTLFFQECLRLIPSAAYGILSHPRENRKDEKIPFVVP